MKRLPDKKFYDVKEALDKISANEWVLVEDVEALLGNQHSGVIFFDREELENRVKRYRKRQQPNDACLFVEWMIKQLDGLVKT